MLHLTAHDQITIENYLFKLNTELWHSIVSYYQQNRANCQNELVNPPLFKFPLGGRLLQGLDKADEEEKVAFLGILKLPNWTGWSGKTLVAEEVEYKYKVTFQIFQISRDVSGNTSL